MNSTTSTQISMFPRQQLVPTVRRSEVSEEQRQAFITMPANNLDGEDSGDDDFHDAQEDPDYDFFNGFGANTQQNAAPPRDHQVGAFSFPQTYTAHTYQNAAPQQPQHSNGSGHVMDLTGDEEQEDTNFEYDQRHHEFDEVAIPDEDFRDLGFDLNQYQHEGAQQTADSSHHQARGGFSFDQQPYQTRGGFSFDRQPQQHQQGQMNGNDFPHEQPQQQQEHQYDGNYASDDQLRNMGILHPNTEDMGATSPNAPQDDDDLFASTFGSQTKDEDADSDIEIVDAPAFDAALKAKGFAFDPSEHSNGCIRNRIPTLPLPTQSTPKSTTPETRPARKKREAPEKDVYGQPFDGRTKIGPDYDRDLSDHLRKHFRFHSKVYDLVPRVPHWEDLDWNRRYWIAVLLEGKKPKNANSERDFVWMKGNRFSTVRTVWEKYVQTTLADRSGVLVMGYEQVEMGDRMEELDYFGDRLCVFRVLQPGHPDLGRAKSLVEGLVLEVIEIDLDDD